MSLVVSADGGHAGSTRRGAFGAGSVIQGNEGNVKVRKGFTRAAAGLITAGLVPLTLAVPAGAATYAYDGKDSIATGCANDATTKATSHLHSGGDWSRAYGPVPFEFTGGYALIHRNSDGKQYKCTLDDESATTCYTAMVYDKDPITSSAYGFDHDWALRHWVDAWTSPY